MAIQQQFTGPDFVLVSARATDASTVVATFNYPPVVGTGTYSLLSAHGDVRTVLQGAGSTDHQINLYTNQPLTQDFWTLTYSNVQEDPSLVLVIPGSFLFWAAVGVPPVGPVTPPFTGEDLTAAQFLRREIPPSMAGDVWSCLIAGLAVGEQAAWDNAPSVDRQMFLATALEEWLDRRAGGLGFERPAGVGMSDTVFRDYTIQVSSRQLTIPAILETLKVFYGMESVQANVQAANEYYTLIDGQTLTITLDGVQTVTVTFLVADFGNISLATAQEVCAVLNREFLLQGVNASAVVASDPNTGVTNFRIFTGTLGARGSIQVESGAAQTALTLPTTLTRLLDQPRAAYVLTRGKGSVEVVFPSTTNIVTRDLTTAAYLSEDYTSPPPSDSVSPYLFESITEGLDITETATTLATSPLVAGQGYRLVAVADSSGFPDAEGWVVFGYGYEYQAGPVHYLGVAGPNNILIDPEYTFTETVPVGASINLLTSQNPPVPELGGSGNFWLTDSPSGRVAAEAAVDAITAAGYTVTKTVSYPGDIGLGNAGYPTHGAQALSDVVQCFAGSDVDGEVETARSE